MRELIETNDTAQRILSLQLKKQLEIERVGIEAKFEGEFSERIEARRKDLLEEDIRQLIASNRPAREIIAPNIKSKVEKEAKTIEEWLGTEYDEKLKAVQKEADTAKRQVDILEEQNPTLMVKTDVQRLQETRELLRMVHKAARDNPDTKVGDVWKEVQKSSRLLSSQLLCLNTTTTTSADTEASTSQPSMSQSPVKKERDTPGADTYTSQQIPTPKGFAGYAFMSTWRSLRSNESDRTPWAQAAVEGPDAALSQTSKDREPAEPVDLGKRVRDSETEVVGREEKRRRLS